MEPIIITVAPNGARKTTKEHAALPVTPETIAREAKACMDAGAAMIHLHVRDEHEGHTLDTTIYQSAIDMINEQTEGGLIIQATTEAVGIYKPEQQMEMVEKLQPEAVSLALRELCPDPSYEEHFGKFLSFLMAEQIMPQYILYSPEEVAYFAKLRKAKVIPGEKVSVLFVLGKKQGNPEAATNPSAQWAKPEDLDSFLECFDGGLKLSETIWNICAFGGHEQECMGYAVACGGSVRLGFENNHLLTDSEIAPNNAALIKGFSDAASGGNRAIASADVARELLKPTISVK